MANITKELIDKRKNIFEKIKKDFSNTPITILEFISLGNPDIHYRHFMVLSEGDLSQEKEQQIFNIFKKYTTRKCELHFNGDILVYEIGLIHSWITSLKSEILNL